MTRKIFTWQVALPALLLSLSVQAHDPSEHMKESEKPDCAAMKKIDPAKMDSDDPVMQAMMRKCLDDMHQEESGPDDSQFNHPQLDESANAESPSKHEH